MGDVTVLHLSDSYGKIDKCDIVLLFLSVGLSDRPSRVY